MNWMARAMTVWMKRGDAVRYQIHWQLLEETQRMSARTEWMVMRMRARMSSMECHHSLLREVWRRDAQQNVAYAPVQWGPVDM